LTIKYIGSKRLLLPHIEALVRELDGVDTVLDLFSGTTRVARLFKQLGYQVHANDTAAYSEVLARAAIATDARRVDRQALAAVIDDLNLTVPDPGWFTANLCEHARYLHPDNGARVDAIRGRIGVEAPDEPLRSLLLSSLLLAADRVDSTAGVQMAYLKRWAPRALKPLQLKLPDLFEGTGSVSRLDAADCARQVGPVDLAYIDPPYNQHSYLGNYHVWETLILDDRPELYGIARKRIDCKTRKSPWNSRRQIRNAFATLLDALQARYLLVSFSDEGYLSTDELHALLEPLGEVQRHDIAHPRYVGARIGIYNPAGKKVGRVGHLHNTERLYLVRCTHREAGRAS
jgi:adenine-specific DNA-methyltransferase